MTKISIIDDEEIFTNILKTLINNAFTEANVEFDVFADLDYMKIAKDLENGKNYDYIFLDYELKEKNGYEVGKLLRQINKDFKLIYVTSHDDKVFECIENGIFFFVRKKHLKEDLDKCLTTIINLEKTNGYFTFPTVNGELRVELSKILYIESVNRNIYLKTESFNIEIKKLILKDIYDVLESKNFIYINKGTIINLKNIAYIDKDIVFLANKEQLLISRRRCKEVNHSYLKYKLEH